MPPTIKVSEPFSAPPTPPETGASRNKIFLSLHFLCKIFALSTSIVEQSVINVPGFKFSIILSKTSSTISPLGNIVIIISMSSVISFKSEASFNFLGKSCFTNSSLIS